MSLEYRPQHKVLLPLEVFWFATLRLSGSPLSPAQSPGLLSAVGQPHVSLAPSRPPALPPSRLPSPSPRYSPWELSGKRRANLDSSATPTASPSWEAESAALSPPPPTRPGQSRSPVSWDLRRRMRIAPRFPVDWENVRWQLAETRATGRWQ